jgi:hypothetical protein
MKRYTSDLEQKVSSFHERSFQIVLRQQISGDLRMNLRVDKADRRSDPFRVHGYILLNRCPDGDLGKARRRRLLATAKANSYDG